MSQPPVGYFIEGEIVANGDDEKRFQMETLVQVASFRADLVTAM